MILFIHSYNNYNSEITNVFSYYGNQISRKMWKVDKLVWVNLMAHVNVNNTTFFKAITTHKYVLLNYFLSEQGWEVLLHYYWMNMRTNKRLLEIPKGINSCTISPKLHQEPNIWHPKQMQTSTMSLGRPTPTRHCATSTAPPLLPKSICLIDVSSSLI
jgi:hypothetical protein